MRTDTKTKGRTVESIRMSGQCLDCTHSFCKECVEIRHSHFFREGVVSTQPTHQTCPLPNEGARREAIEEERLAKRKAREAIEVERLARREARVDIEERRLEELCLADFTEVQRTSHS